MNETVNIYQNQCDFEGRNGRTYSGLRWIIRYLDGTLLTTKKTRKAAIESAQNNLGFSVKIKFGRPE